MSNSLNFNNSFLINNQLSPFLVKGIYNNKEINYDIHFSLDNLILVNLKGSPKLIGNGSFGKVYLAKNKNDNKYYAIKHMIKSNLIKYLNNLEQIYNEINIQSRAYHPNIIQLFYVKETDEAFDLVLEYSKYGTLFDYMLKCNGLNENLVFIFFIQIVNAIKFLHENNVIHRDIKPENILLFDNYIVKLCDFGWSVKTESRLPGGSFSGTPEYMAPELINNEDYGKEIDIWMLGILLYELVHCFSPFRPKKQKFEEKELIENIKNHEILFYMPCSDEYKQLVFDLLESDVEKRLTIDDIYNSKFVKKHEKEDFSIKDINGNYNSEENQTNNSFNTNDKKDEQVENTCENNMINRKKKLLITSYKNFDEFNELKKNMDNNKTEIYLDNPNDNDEEKNIIIKRKESDKITTSINNNSDIYEKKEISPKNNNRGKKNRVKTENSGYFKFSSNSNNPNKKEIGKNNNTLVDSLKNGKKENLAYNFDFNSVLKNTFLNNKFQKRKKYNQIQFKNKKLDMSEENIKIQNIQITNYIFNNKENKDKTFTDISDLKKDNLKEENKRCLTKKLSINQKNQILSLSLVNGNVDYNLLLNHSPSTESQMIDQKDKNSVIDNNKLNYAFINSTIQENQKIINNKISQKLKEFPFDHFICNSSMNIHIQKTIFNNKMIKIKRLKNTNKKEGKKYIEILDKEPNDNMRRRNKKIRNEMPLDNLKKEKDKEKKEIKDVEIKPVDNYLKAENINSNKDNIHNKDINKNINKENINKMNLVAEIIQNKKIVDIKNKRNYSVRNNNFRTQKSKKYSKIDDNHLLRKRNNEIQQNKCLDNSQNNESKKVFMKNNIFTNKSKFEKMEEINKNFRKNNDINNSLVKTNMAKKYLSDKITDFEIDKLKYRNINKRARSVNKKNEFKFNKKQSTKSSKNIINKKELSKIKKITKIKTNINAKSEKIKYVEENQGNKIINSEDKLFELKSTKDIELNQIKAKNFENELISKEQYNNNKVEDAIDDKKNTKINIEKNEKDFKSKKNNIMEIKENKSMEIIIKENNKSKNIESIKKEEQNVEKKIIEEKYDNFKEKEIYRKEILKTKNRNSSKNIKYQNIYNKENNLEKNIRFSEVIKKYKKPFKTESNQKKRDSLKSNKSFTQSNLKQKIEKEEFKLCLENIKQNLKENFIKENKTPRLNFESKKKLINIDKQEIKISSLCVYPKKIASDINSSNSSIFEYEKPQNTEEKSFNSSKKIKINFSNSESKVIKYSNNQISNIKKIKAFSDINCDNSNNKISKSPNLFKNFEEQKDFKFKIEKSINQLKNNNNNSNSNKNIFLKKQKYKKMHKNKTDISLQNNLEINKFNNNKKIKKLKKDNSNLNKKINRIIKTRNNNSKNDKSKNMKKRYRKSLTESERDKNEIKGNDSESYIIEGDSEYGDADVF